MTSKEILKGDVIDILFENRNKAYGAYALRKNYANRMAIALGVTISSVVLILLLLQPNNPSSGTIFQPDKGSVIVTDIEFPPIPEEPPPPPPPVESPQLAQIDHTNIVIVPNDQATPIATIDEIANRQIGTIRIEGELSTHAVPVVDPVLPGGTGSTATVQESTTIIDPIEVQPSFPGGMNAWISFLQRHLRVPEELEPGVKITVMVRFIVGTDGSIDNFEVVQSGGASFDREVIRVLKKMPRWTPAVQNGHPASTSFTQPVSFQVYEQ